MSQIGDNNSRRLTFFHPRASEAIREYSETLRWELGDALRKLQDGESLSLPLSRPMPAVVQGAHELRLKDEAGIYRVFYYVKSPRGVLVFHVFTKKSKQTPDREIRLGRKRIKEMLSNG